MGRGEGGQGKDAAFARLIVWDLLCLSGWQQVSSITILEQLLWYPLHLLLFSYYFGAILDSVREVRIEEETFLEDKALDGNFVIHPQERTTPVHLPGDMADFTACSSP